MINFYRIVSPNTNKVYIGSTKQTLKERFRCHNKDYKSYLDGKQHYISANDILEFKDCKIELIENKFCETKSDRCVIERHHILNTLNTVNKQQNPGLFNELGEIKYNKQYHHKNKEQIKAKNNQKQPCICGVIHNHSVKKRHERSQKHINYLLQHP
jgi:hypothetical protein